MNKIKETKNKKLELLKSFNTEDIKNPITLKSITKKLESYDVLVKFYYLDYQGNF